MWLMILELFEVHCTHTGGYFLLRLLCSLLLFSGKNHLRASPQLVPMKACNDVQSCTLGAPQAAKLALMSDFLLQEIKIKTSHIRHQVTLSEEGEKQKAPTASTLAVRDRST